MFAAPLLAGAGGAAAAGSTLAAISTGLSVATGIMGTIAAVNEAKFNAAVAEQNAEIAEENRVRAIQEGQLAAQRADLDASQELGLLIANQAASGLSGGSHALQRKTMRELAGRDRGTIIYEATAKGARFGQQAQDYRITGKAERMAGKFAAVSGVLGVGSSLISGASKYSVYRARELERAGGIT